MSSMDTQSVSLTPPQSAWLSGDLEVAPLSKHIGAEIKGIDLSSITDAQFEAIHAAWLQHLVLVFRDQDLSDEDLVAFSARFGELDLAPLDANGRYNAPTSREILVISNVMGDDGKPIGALGAGEAVWHIDMSYNPVPPKGSALYALEIPSSGGETGFLNCYAAFAGLPKTLQDQIAGLAIKHDATLNSAGIQRAHLDPVGDVRTSPGAWHPAVHTHPETGRKALYLGRRKHAYVEGLTIDESEKLLDAIWDAATHDDFSWHHSWRKGDLVLWDNRCAMHRRNPFDGSQRRVMHRTQIQGSAPQR